MGLLKPKASFFDPIRQERVKKSPEERVRQGLLRHMLEELGYPRALLAVEKELGQLPTICTPQLPKRRIDIVAFAKGLHPKHPLFPLLLIECKAAPLSHKMTEQVISYNESVQAPFVALANDSEIWLGYFVEGEGYRFSQGLPRYETLLQSVERDVRSRKMGSSIEHNDPL